MNTSTLLIHNAVRAAFLMYEQNRRKFLRMAGVVLLAMSVGFIQATAQADPQRVVYPVGFVELRLLQDQEQSQLRHDEEQSQLINPIPEDLPEPEPGSGSGDALTGLNILGILVCIANPMGGVPRCFATDAYSPDSCIRVPGAGWMCQPE